MKIEDQIHFNQYLACATVLMKQMKMKMASAVAAINLIIITKR